ncbi:MAG TPA: hypothetical protein DEF02_03160 [Clostridiales bacterium]|nr:hypothetical protein [Clostridiales bacterium]HBP52700.1 hypothetical protein [Clostridiales bacterium]HBW05568.1 hypothetical protein [Clostridiales bacterium]HCH92934.1 hypothetical protein [Clostridiales bacterium]
MRAKAMIQELITQISNAIGNPYLTLYVISIIPIIELRGAILFMPYMFDTLGEMMLGMLCCIAGSTTVIVPLILITRPLLKKLRHSKWFSKIGKRMEANLADRAESAYDEEKSEEREAKRKRKPLSKDTKKFLGLFAFVAVPLPMTGAWTGSCIGSFLDFPVWKASLAVFLGNIVAGLILTTIAYFLPRQYADVFLYGFVVLAIAIAVTLYFSRSKRNERKRNAELEKYSNKSEYELAVLKKEADKDGKVLIKKEYIDENGDKHIVIGRDEKRNKSVVDKDDLI